jgi:hypothetical protein
MKSDGIFDAFSQHNVKKRVAYTPFIFAVAIILIILLRLVIYHLPKSLIKICTAKTEMN